MKYTQKVIDMIVNKYSVGDCPDIDWAIYQSANDSNKVSIGIKTDDFVANGITKAEISGVPSSKEFNKLQKDNAKLAKRVLQLEKNDSLAGATCKMILSVLDRITKDKHKFDTLSDNDGPRSASEFIKAEVRHQLGIKE